MRAGLPMRWSSKYLRSSSQPVTNPSLRENASCSTRCINAHAAPRHAGGRTGAAFAATAASRSDANSSNPSVCATSNGRRPLRAAASRQVPGQNSAP